MKQRIEIPTGVSHYETEIIMKDADPDDFNMIASQYDVGERWVEMQERAFAELDENSDTLEDFDMKCQEISDEFGSPQEID